MDPPVRKRPQRLPANRARTPNRPRDPNRVLERRGILPQQQARNPLLSRFLYESVGPMEADYYRLPDEVGEDEMRPRSSAGMLAEAAKAVGRRVVQGPRATRRGDTPQEDAYRMFLGLPQQNGSLRVSEHRPSRAVDPKATYYALPGLRDEIEDWANLEDLAVDLDEAGGSMVMNLNDAGRHGEALSQATLGLGEDERGRYVSVYDEWDLEAPGARLVGKPFEVYDRFYLPPRNVPRRPRPHRQNPPTTPATVPADATAWASRPRRER